MKQHFAVFKLETFWPLVRDKSWECSTAFLQTAAKTLYDTPQNSCHVELSRSQSQARGEGGELILRRILGTNHGPTIHPTLS